MRTLSLLAPLLFVGVVAAPSAARAATYYVSPTGSASWPTCTDIAAPCGPHAAMQNAVAGDIVYFRGGTYQLGYNPNYEVPVLAPAHSGTAASPITFAAYPGETPILNTHVRVKLTGIAGPGSGNTLLVDNNVNFTTAGIVEWDIVRTSNHDGGAPVAAGGVTDHTVALEGFPHNSINLSPGDPYEIGGDQAAAIGNGFQDHIVLEGFVVQSDDGREAGKLYINGPCGDSRAVGNVVRNVTINGGSRPTVHADNRDGLRIDCTSNTRVDGCTIYNRRSITDSWNSAAIKLYHDDHLTIRNCELFDSTTGIYAKSDCLFCTFENNFVHDNYLGIFVTTYDAGIQQNADNSLIRNNVSINNTYQAILIYGQDGAHSDNTEIAHNTIYCAPTAWGLSYSEGQGYRVRDNVIQGCDNRQYTNAYANIGVTESDYNQFGSAPLTIVTRLYQANQGTYHTLAGWQASSALTGGGNPDLHSMASDPQFENASGTLTQLPDFRLSAGSPSKGAGSGGQDMGARICAVGPNPTCAGFGDSVAPAAPTNLTVQ